MKNLSKASIESSTTIINNPLWLSVSEAAKFGGVQTKTIRRALKLEKTNDDQGVSDLKFRIIKNRYQIELSSLLIYLHSTKKLLNKYINYGIGQYLKSEK